MKIAILSDFHFGFNEDALPQAKQALLMALDKSDIAIIPGDLFDTRVQKYEVLEEAFAMLSEMKNKSQAKVKIYSKDGSLLEERENAIIAVAGTHERRSKGLTNVLQLLDSVKVLVNAHNLVVSFEKDGERIAIHGLGGVPEEFFKPLLKGIAFAPLENQFNIFMFHQNLKEFIPFGDWPTLLDLPKGFDLYVNGHIHSRHELKVHDGERERHLLIPGSTVITQMKENEMEKKGFYVFDTKSKNAEFHYIDSRPFFYKVLQFENADLMQVARETLEALNELKHEAKDSLSRKPLVKLKLRGSLKNGLISSDLQELSRMQQEFPEFVLSIDKDFDANESLREKLESLKAMHGEAKNVKSLGIDLLKEMLSTKNLSFNVEELFELLAEDESDKAMQLLISK